MSSYYVTCPNCGAHLDPGERCDRDKAPAVTCRQTDQDEKQKK